MSTEDLTPPQLDPPPAPPPQLDPVVPVENLGALLKDTVQPWPHGPAAGVLVDVEGKAFTKGVHLTRKDGTPAVNPKTGRLIRLPKGQRDPGAVAADPVEQPNVFKPVGAGSDQVQAGAVDDQAVTAVEQTEDEKQAGATANAEILVELWQLGAVVFFGVEHAPFEPDQLTKVNEDRRLYDTGRRWLLATGRTHPGSALVMHLLHGVRYLLRVWARRKGVKVPDEVKP